MERRNLLAALAAIALSGCETTAAGPASGPAATAIERNGDVARVLAGLRERGIAVAPTDDSKVEAFADAPGYAYSIGTDYLHLHAYPDAAGAAAARARFLTGSPTTLVSWVGQPHLFGCGSAVALYLGSQPAPIAALTALCGAPSAPR